MKFFRRNKKQSNPTDKIKQQETTLCDTVETQTAQTPIHAHEITANDAALIRMMAGASFSDDSTVVLPSGKTVNGAEMRRWVSSHDSQ